MLEIERRRALLSIISRERPQWLEATSSLRKGALKRQLRLDPTTSPQADELAESMAMTSARISPRTGPMDLTAEDVDALEAIVFTTLRPALLVQDGTFLPPPAEWSHLEQYRNVLDYAIARTCRIEVTGDSDLDWIGTGFVIGPGMIATNRHVLDLVAGFDGKRWRFDPEVTLRVDFKEEIGGSAPVEVPVTGIWGVHDRFDLAILSVPPRAVPSPLIAGGGPAVVDDVVVVGYSAYDSRRNDVDAMERIFRGIYNVKRVLPGRLMARDRSRWTLRHDASTLGGNSGSPVIALSTGKLVGIHCRGRYLLWNEALDLSRT